jgi:HlyD family secretion protein
MRRAFSKVLDRSAGRCWLLFGLLAAVATSGCGHQAKIEFAKEDKPPAVRLIRPEVRNIVRTVGQPSFIEAFERTSVYPKPSAYIKEWKVDIGDKVKKGDVLATLFAPEWNEEHGTKGATVTLDVERIALAEEMVRVATADVKAAEAKVREAKAILDKYEAEVERWDAQVKRLRREVDRVVVDARILQESDNELKASVAARDQAKATIKRTEAELLSRQQALEKAGVYVRVTKADLKVAESEQKRLQAWVDYLTLTAPYDGIITVRNANTLDFVLPQTGDPTTASLNQSPHASPSGAAAPIYVVERTDKVRIFVDIPEGDANYVHEGTKASVLVKGYRDEPFPGTVTRTAWALNFKSRTLRAEIDLPNPGQQLLPGMYAYAKVIIERPEVRALPVTALTYVDDKAYCWTYEKGRAKRTSLRTGVSDGEWIEVTNRELPLVAVTDGQDPWVPIDGKEQVILGDLSLLADGSPVQVAPAQAGTQLASDSQAADLGRANTPIAPGAVEVSNDPVRSIETEL